MRAKYLFLPALLTFSLFAATPLRAQSATQQPSSASAAAPAAPDTKTPDTQTQDAKSDAKPAPKPATKKVWTNENMDSLTGPTYEADPNAQRRANRYYPRSYSAPNNATYYKNQIASLRTKIEDIDRKLDNYNALAHGEAPGQGEKNTGVRLTDSRYDLQALAQQREKLQKQISDLEDQARHAGIEPGDLR